MKIGIINCDPLNPKVIATYGDYPLMFSKLFSLVANHITFERYDAFNSEFPKDMDSCDAYLISGSHFSVYDDEPWIQLLLDFIKKLWLTKKKTIGICFGHQAIACALGGVVKRAPNGWRKGVVTTEVVEKKTWMTPWLSQFRVCVSHQDQVLKLPSSGECIVKTDCCPYAVIQYEELFLSFQGHPEFSHVYTKHLINKRRGLFDDATYQLFIDSLSQKANSKLLARWIINFLVN